MKKTFSDQQIIAALLKGGKDGDAALRQVYVLNRSAVFDFVKKNNGTTEEAKDVFQDSIVAFYENIQAGKFKGESTVSTYIYSIAKFIWMNRLKRKGTGKKILTVLEVPEKDPGFFPTLLEKEKEESVLKIFNQLGTDCRKVLILHIYQHYSMKEIACEMQYENEQIARNKKYKCLKKLKSLIAEKPDIIKFLHSPS
ncbi:MAG TPA: sigma-70 family RNA polymerase sigma factor [Bacteroidetes bacterium]|nr:sigma-70 family RNA polymerase sigma factor [Bacteroidota bacterium]